MQSSRFRLLHACRWSLLIGTFICSSPGLAQTSKVTTVTTYVTTVQEERQSTRFTLTEWLRIKERMKLMDVYLAMFSNPKKDDFSPELHISYMASRGTVKFTGEGSSEEAATAGDEGRAQFWLTNLVTSSVGVRMLNIDFGLEVYQRSSGDFSPSTTGEAVGASGSSFAAISASPNLSSTRRMLTRYGSMNFRLFGKSVQDSMLVAKVGRYEHTNSIPLVGAVGDGVSIDQTAGASEAPDARTWRGLVSGVDMQLYFMNWLGAEGSYCSYGESGTGKGSSEFSGATYAYGPFIEVSLLRLSIGRYSESWRFQGRNGEPLQVTDEGISAGARINF